MLSLLQECILGYVLTPNFCKGSLLLSVDLVHADLVAGMKGIRALAPNCPDIAVALDSNQNLVDNYIKVCYVPVPWLLKHVGLIKHANMLCNCIHEALPHIFSL